METQPTQQQMTGDEAAAALAMATQFMEQSIAPQTPKNAPGKAKMPNMETDSTNDIKDEIMRDVRSAIREEMSGLRQDIQNVLDEENNQNEQKD